MENITIEWVVGFLIGLGSLIVALERICKHIVKPFQNLNDHIEDSINGLKQDIEKKFDETNKKIDNNTAMIEETNNKVDDLVDDMKTVKETELASIRSTIVSQCNTYLEKDSMTTNESLSLSENKQKYIDLGEDRVEKSILELISKTQGLKVHNRTQA